MAMLFTFCKKDDQPQPECSKDLRIRAVWPSNNPVTAPVLIKGKNFSANTKVFFDSLQAEVNFIADSILTTRVPGGLIGTNGLVELKVEEGVCEFTTGFRITAGFEDFDRASPPTIFFPKVNEKIVVNLEDSISSHSFGYNLYNIWGSNQTLRIENASEQEAGIIIFDGEEFMNADATRFNTLKGTYIVSQNKVSVIIYHDEEYYKQEILPADKLEGGFYQTTIPTRTGSKMHKILYLQSQITGRQYIFEL
jgi:hypothetical protein